MERKVNVFFIGIFGIENKDEEIKVLENINCRKCNSTVTGRLIKNFVFFISYLFQFLNGMKDIVLYVIDAIHYIILIRKKGKLLSVEKI